MTTRKNESPKAKLFFHGELCIVEHAVPPTRHVEQLEVAATGDIKLADSETTGNHHMLKVIPGVHVFQDVDNMDKYFVRLEMGVDTKIYCKLENRHTALVLKGGHEYEIFPVQEFDHIEKAARKVLD